jgi:hypothetical protein
MAKEHIFHAQIITLHSYSSKVTFFVSQGPPDSNPGVLSRKYVVLSWIAFAGEMASLRRSKALSPDGQTARFLYTILKQLDLKAIDWNLVAEGLDITNGHAARMRFSRFKQHMEGIPTQPRNPRPKKDGTKDTKNVKGKGLKRGPDGDIKGEDMKGEDGEAEEARIKSEPSSRVKGEPGVMEDSKGIEQPPAVRVKREPDADEIASQPTSRPGYLTQPMSGYELVPAANLAFATPLTTSARNPSILSPPPMATVSLADLHLSATSIPPTPCFGKATPSFVFADRTAAAIATTNQAVMGVKAEFDLMGIPMHPASDQPLVKSEPIDA